MRRGSPELRDRGRFVGWKLYPTGIAGYITDFTGTPRFLTKSRLTTNLPAAYTKPLTSFTGTKGTYTCWKPPMKTTFSCRSYFVDLLDSIG